MDTSTTESTLTLEPLIMLHPMQRAVLRVHDNGDYDVNSEDYDPAAVGDFDVIVVALGAFSHLPYVAHGNGVERADAVYEVGSYDFRVREYDITPVEAR